MARGKKNNGERKGYFYEQEEQALKDYLTTQDKEEKNRIFNK